MKETVISCAGGPRCRDKPETKKKNENTAVLLIVAFSVQNIVEVFYLLPFLFLI